MRGKRRGHRQDQGICLVRGCYDSRIITLPLGVFDEDGTGKLDAENETAIQEALSRLIKNKTVLIIAHRMRTIANADNIVVLKDGVVAEQGSPETLSAYDSIYSRMTARQLISQNWKM